MFKEDYQKMFGRMYAIQINMWDLWVNYMAIMSSAFFGGMNKNKKK